VIREQHLRVGRTARFCTLGEAGPDVRQLWIVCHGYRQLARRFLARFRCVADATRLIVAPEGLSRFYRDDDGGPHGPAAPVGASWMTREDRASEIRDYVEYLDDLHDHVRRGLPAGRLEVLALGFSQGAATASRWAALGRSRIGHLVLWGSPPAHDLELERLARRGTRLTLVAGSDDRFAGPTVMERERSRIAAAGGAAHLLRFDGGHGLDDATLRRLAEET
jgi:predicted esterase